MKKSKLLIGIGLLLIGAVMVSLYAGKAEAVVKNTAHDLRSGGSSAYKGSSDQICIYCHAPHGAVGSTFVVPLWNRAIQATTTYTMYSSTTLNAIMPGTPTGYSKACLSCHDGTVAADAYGAVTGSHFITSGGGFIDTNLSNDHPISFPYNAALVTADTLASGGVVGLATPESNSKVVTGIPLYSSNLECSSCHSVHDDTNGDFLRFSNSGSDLCLKCHIK